MKAFVITISGHKFSEHQANRCIESGQQIGNIAVEIFYGIDKTRARSVMENCGLTWTWANNNTKQSICPITKLKQRPYYNANLEAKIGCSMSHYFLWKLCVELNEPILILEHDAVFVRKMPDINFRGICQINDPKGGGRNGSRLQETMIRRGTVGVHRKTPNSIDRLIPDGLAGNSAYMIKPFAAQELIDKYHQLGVWPNDATMCVQLFPYLEEYYPFITKVEHKNRSTSSE
jgi:GR25 family glycosyltransferase involved in LPS biosynthesis